MGARVLARRRVTAADVAALRAAAQVEPPAAARRALDAPRAARRDARVDALRPAAAVPLIRSHASFARRRAAPGRRTVPHSPGASRRRAQRRSLFDSMSNHIANSVNWLPETSSSATSTTVAAGMPLPEQPQHRLEDPEHETGDRHHDPERVEEDERMEVADHVLLPHAPEEGLDEQPRDPRHDLAETDPGPLADPVDRSRRDVAHAGVDDVQVDEHVVREPVPRVDALEVEPGRACRRRSPCTPPASRRCASSRRRSSSAARERRCPGSGCAGSDPRPVRRSAGWPSRSRPRRGRPGRRSPPARPDPSGCRPPSPRRRRCRRRRRGGSR